MAPSSKLYSIARPACRILAGLVEYLAGFKRCRVGLQGVREAHRVALRVIAGNDSGPVKRAIGAEVG